MKKERMKRVLKTPVNKNWPFLLFWSLVLTALTGLLGFAPLRFLRAQIGGARFLFLALAASALLLGLKLPMMALAFLITAAMVLAFSEAADGGFSLGVSASIGLLTGTTVLVLAGAFAIRAMGPTWLDLIRNQIDAQIARMAEMNFISSTVLTSESVFRQLPSVFFCLLMVGLGTGLILEVPYFRTSSRSTGYTGRLTDFRVHPAFVWAVIGALLLAFFDFGIEATRSIGINLLNCLAVLFFFQGLAILCRYFEVLRVGTAWRVFWLFVFVTQLFLVLSVVGFVDYWFEFRSRLKKVSGQVVRRSKQ
jgi:hypothetical protein